MSIRDLIPQLDGQSEAERSVSDRRDWVLALLYAPDPTGTSAVAVPSEFTLSLGLFAITRQLKAVSGRESPFSFAASERGPTDAKLADVLSELEDDGLIENQGSPETELDIDENEYVITEEGREWIEPAYEQLSSSEQSEIERIKYEHITGPTGDLLVYCFGMDPTRFTGDLVR
jgi:hypothetical protein